MKHVERRHFFIREAVEDMRVRVPFVRTVDNVADFFTKPLPSKQFFAMRNLIVNVPHRSDCDTVSHHGGVLRTDGS